MTNSMGQSCQAKNDPLRKNSFILIKDPIGREEASAADAESYSILDGSKLKFYLGMITDSE